MVREHSKPSRISYEFATNVLYLSDVNSTWKVMVSVERIYAVRVVVISIYSIAVSSSFQVRF